MKVVTLLCNLFLSYFQLHFSFNLKINLTSNNILSLVVTATTVSSQAFSFLSMKWAGADSLVAEI